MQRLIHQDITPPGGFRFIDPDDGYEYAGPYHTFTDLSDHVARRRSIMGLPPLERFRTMWEAWICSNQWGMDGKCCPVSAEVRRNFSQFWRGAKTYFRAAFLRDDAFVEQETADERASVCVGCDQNLNNIAHAAGQHYSDQMVAHQVGHRKSAHHDQLYTCTICSCLLRSKVFYRDELVASSLSDEEVGRLNRYPRNVKTGRKVRCWQLQVFRELEAEEAAEEEQ